MGGLSLIHISFLSGTRADFSKIKPYIEYLSTQKNIRVHIFITAMHMLKKYGSTYMEIKKAFSKTCVLHYDKNFSELDTASETAHIIKAYSDHLKKNKIEHVFIHGDRAEALAGTIAATFNNIPVTHIEAGDLSGSVDESLRHAITKLSHSFFVADAHAKQVLLQLGEKKSDIYIVGNSSLANDFGCDTDVLKKYKIPFAEYGILIYHPVTTQTATVIAQEIRDIMETLLVSGLNYVVICPNNDLNSNVILQEYEKYQSNAQFCFFKSLPLNDFHQLLIHARFLIGNSSCGIKEAPLYHIPVIDVGNRQQNRYQHLKYEHLSHAKNKTEIKKYIQKIQSSSISAVHVAYRKEFFSHLKNIFKASYWHKTTQKKFIWLNKD